MRPDQISKQANEIINRCRRQPSIKHLFLSYSHHYIYLIIFTRTAMHLRTGMSWASSPTRFGKKEAWLCPHLSSITKQIFRRVGQTIIGWAQTLLGDWGELYYRIESTLERWVTLPHPVFFTTNYLIRGFFLLNSGDWRTREYVEPFSYF